MKKRPFLSFFNNGLVSLIKIRMSDFNKEIEFRAKWFTESDMGKKTEEEIEKDYIFWYRYFYDNIIQNEMIWARAVRTVHRMDEMF